MGYVAPPAQLEATFLCWPGIEIRTLVLPKYTQADILRHPGLGRHQGGTVKTSLRGGVLFLH